MAVDFSGSTITIPRLFPGKPKLDAAFFRGMKDATIHIQKLARSNITNKKGFKAASGALAKSIAREIKVEGGALVGRIGSPLVYAGVQEGLDRQGRSRTKTTIRAKKKYLTIPVGPALTRAGRPRFTSVRKVPNVKFIKRRGKPPLWAQVHNKRLLVFFVGKKEVTITARPYMRPALKKGLPRVEVIIMNELMAVVDG